MPPKRTSTSEAPAMTQAAIKKLVADRSSGSTSCNNGKNCAEEKKVTFATVHLTMMSMFLVENAYAQAIGMNKLKQIHLD
ncbi:hypothetical protein Tco_1564300 [Tanacetum coccineum]